MITPENLNRWRIIPRGLMVLYGWMCVETFQWFTAIQEPNNAQSIFSSAVIGAGAAWFSIYVNGEKHDPTGKSSTSK